MKLKITDLTEEREFFKRQENLDGSITRVPYTKRIKRKVKTVQGGKRFGHYLIDYVIMLGISFVFAFAGVFASTSTSSNGIELLFNFAGLIITLLYYFISELTLGTTVGKMATNSIVINEYGEKPPGETLFIRSACRLIPFEAFSCLGERGWHDTLSKTFVVTKTEHAELQRLLAEQAGNGHVDDREDLLD